MNKLGKILVTALFLSSISSCYVNTFTVGNGPQTGVEERKVNHYLVQGLIPLKVVDTKTMVGDAENYQITTKQSFVDVMFNYLSFGIYSPTSTIVKK
jgi:Bor protein.